MSLGVRLPHYSVIYRYSPHISWKQLSKVSKFWWKGALRSLLWTTQNLRFYLTKLQSCILHQDLVNLHF